MATRKPIRIRFVGDISFNGRYVERSANGDDPFVAISEVLADADLTVGNLECLVHGMAQNELKVPRIHTSAEALDTLKKLHVRLVSLATNHVYDNLKEGFEKTVKRLDELGIEHIGASTFAEEAAFPFIFEKEGWKIGFLNYVHEDTNPKLPDSADVYPNLYWLHKVVEDIARLKQEVDRVVVLLHWGGKCDYGYLPHHEQLEHAKQMVDAGADAIIGHHTHTFQAHLIHRNTPVFFSLGNFCFDDIVMGQQVFKVRQSGKKGAVVELQFADEVPTRFRLFPFRSVGLDLVPDDSLLREFRFWQSVFSLVRTLPGAYRFYYYLLKRWEPVHFHAQQQGTTMLGVAVQKVKRIFGFR